MTDLQIHVRRALEAWDCTVLPKSNDGMMQERMEDLRAALAQPEPDPNQAAAIVLMSAAAKSGDPRAIELAAILANAAPCEKCGYVWHKCRCAQPEQQALENCRLYAARYRKEEWATTILRFCAEGGAAGSPLRAQPEQQAVHQQNLGAMARAADMLTAYAELIRRDGASHVEEHHYIPDVEWVANELRSMAEHPPAQPLTPEQIEQHIGPDEGDREAVIEIVRQVEKLHRIVGKEQG